MDGLVPSTPRNLASTNAATLATLLPKQLVCRLHWYAPLSQFLLLLTLPSVDSLIVQELAAHVCSKA